MERIVQHLRLRAPSAAAARSALPLLEDALRCASLPDEGEHLLLVRRLALGRIDAALGAQALARLIEQRVAQAGWQWVPGGTPEADTAAAVWFGSRLQARVSLSLALLAGTAPQAWYWPLAVPEAWRDEGHDTPLQRIVRTLATRPGGAAPQRAQLVAWLQAVLPLHGSAAVASWLGPALWAQCLQAWPGPAFDDAAAAPPARPGRLQHTAAQAGDRVPSPGRSRAKARLPAKERAGPPVPLSASLSASPSAQTSAPVPAPFPAPTAVPARTADRSTITAQPGGPPPRRYAEAGTRPPLPTPPRLRAGARQGAPAHTDAMRGTSPALPAFGLQPTRAAGLLFLLPVLYHLRLFDREDAAAGARIRALLARTLARMRLPAHDAAWRLVACTPSPAAAPAPAPVTTTGPVTHTLRTWLRQHAGIGLARLVLRPGLLSLSPTHVDVRFELVQADVRIRRLGLDISPGWDAAYGRVVTVHYGAPW